MFTSKSSIKPSCMTVIGPGVRSCTHWTNSATPHLYHFIVPSVFVFCQNFACAKEHLCIIVPTLLPFCHFSPSSHVICFIGLIKRFILSKVQSLQQFSRTCKPLKVTFCLSVSSSGLVCLFYKLVINPSTPWSKWGNLRALRFTCFDYAGNIVYHRQFL